MYFYVPVCETQRTRMHVTDTTATPNDHQMTVVTCDWSIGDILCLVVLQNYYLVLILFIIYYN